MEAEITARRELLIVNPHPNVEQWLGATPRATLDLVASFQATVVRELMRHAEASAEQIDAQSLIISGGVACNSGLRMAANKARLGYPVFFPDAGLSTDNAAMIGAAAYPKFLRKDFADFTLQVDPNLALT